MYMKRVAVIAIFMAVMASLFAFPVFADTPVQPLQVVTYSDTTTNVRISGTAERLHYNVDSFQVVFMNPPNNYGTACTPILVSFRFYNASDIPAYVGQAEFELTATNGTGAVNTIIYGYDQISTDLFVAESSYSTAEVGRIGIGASNDFAYYTGFVIPPRTSLYFSCIVYVNASAYGQNNTGATEDVNQVTLSALNLYTNQISFSEDYPYYGEPIDFSQIIDAITDLADTVSTSSELQEVIDQLTYSGSGFNSAITNGVRYSSSERFNNVRLIVQYYRGYPVYSTLSNNLDSSNDNIITGGTVKYPIYVKVQINNYSGHVYNVYYAHILKELLPHRDNALHIEYFDSNYYDSFNNVTNRYWFDLIVKDKFIVNNTDAVLPMGISYLVLSGYVELPYGVEPNFGDYASSNSFDVFFNGSLFTVNDGYYPLDDYVILKDLYLAYSSVNGLNDIDDTADDIKDKSESAHTQEQSYFTQNAQAIQQTGLSNYRFNGDQENGIGSVSHDFTLLWNALGGFNSIYIFSLTLSLALMILRHAPGAIRSSRRNKEE